MGRFDAILFKSSIHEISIVNLSRPEILFESVGWPGVSAFAVVIHSKVPKRYKLFAGYPQAIHLPLQTFHWCTSSRDRKVVSTVEGSPPGNGQGRLTQTDRPVPGRGRQRQRRLKGETAVPRGTPECTPERERKRASPEASRKVQCRAPKAPERGADGVGSQPKGRRLRPGARGTDRGRSARLVMT